MRRVVPRLTIPGSPAHRGRPQRAARLVLAAALALAADAQAGRKFETPQGTLEIRHTLEQREVPGIFPQSWAQVVRLVNDTQGGLHWVSFRLEHAGAFTWPRGQRVYLVLEDSSLVRDSLALVCEPKQRMTQRPYPPLGSAPLTVEPDELWREACAGGPCTQLFVAFPRAELPRGFTVKQVSDVRVGDLGRPARRTAGGR